MKALARAGRVTDVRQHSSRAMIAAAAGRCHHDSCSLPSNDHDQVESIYRLHESVIEAHAQGRPVVALESTILTHGMKFPENYSLTRRLAEIFLQHAKERVIPATTAIHKGVCRIGLSIKELHELTTLPRERILKCSTRDIPLLVARQLRIEKLKNKEDDFLDADSVPLWGATTVSSSLVLAHAARIPVFCTGGLGGVHRDFTESMDVSTDLTQLAQTPVVAVCAGMKSILDIPKSLQVLESLGVPVVGYRTDEFPAFFSPHSNCPVSLRLDDPYEIAEAYWAARSAGLKQGMVVAVPNPKPAYDVEDVIQAALKLAKARKIQGPAVTPFVLEQVARDTQGASLQSNLALVERNAQVAADIAIAIADLGRERSLRTLYPTRSIEVPMAAPSATPPTQPKLASRSEYADKATVIVVGGILLDIMARPVPGCELVLKTSNPAICTESDGGVGRNIAEVLGRLGCTRTLLFSVVGNDDRGHALVQRLESECGVADVVNTVQIANDKHSRTATYLAVLDGEGDLHTACADTEVLAKIKCPPKELISQASMVILDANPPIKVLEETATLAYDAGVPVFLEPTSVPKAIRVGQDDLLMSRLTYASPSVDELLGLGASWTDENEALKLVKEENFETIQWIANNVLRRMNPANAHLLITMGGQGVLLASLTGGEKSSFVHFPAISKGMAIANATGAGDSFAGAFVDALLKGRSMEQSIQDGMLAAELSLKCPDRAISPMLSRTQ